MKKCEFCKETFVPAVKKTRFCSKTCANRSRYQKALAAPPDEYRECQGCGESFPVRYRCGQKSKVVCNPNCMAKLKYKRKKAGLPTKTNANHTNWGDIGYGNRKREQAMAKLIPGPTALEEALWA